MQAPVLDLVAPYVGGGEVRVVRPGIVEDDVGVAAARRVVERGASFQELHVPVQLVLGVALGDAVAVAVDIDRVGEGKLLGAIVAQVGLERELVVHHLCVAHRSAQGALVSALEVDHRALAIARVFRDGVDEAVVRVRPVERTVGAEHDFLLCDVLRDGRVHRPEGQARSNEGGVAVVGNLEVFGVEVGVEAAHVDRRRGDARAEVVHAFLPGQQLAGAVRGQKLDVGGGDKLDGGRRVGELLGALRAADDDLVTLEDALFHRYVHGCRFAGFHLDGHRAGGVAHKRERQGVAARLHAGDAIGALRAGGPANGGAHELHVHAGNGTVRSGVGHSAGNLAVGLGVGGGSKSYADQYDANKDPKSVHGGVLKSFQQAVCSRAANPAAQSMR